MTTLTDIIERREARMYQYYKSVFHEDFNGGYPASYDEELLRYMAADRLALLEAGLKEVGEDEFLCDEFDMEEGVCNVCTGCKLNAERLRMRLWFTAQIEKITEQR